MKPGRLRATAGIVLGTGMIAPFAFFAAYGSFPLVFIPLAIIGCFGVVGGIIALAPRRLSRAA